MTTPRWLTRARRIRDDILENDAAIRQILGDRATRASFEGNVIERIQLAELEKERGQLSWRLIQALARGAGLDPYAVDEVTRRRMLSNFLGTGTTSSAGGDTTGTPETPLVPSHPVHPGDHRRYLGWSDDTSIAPVDLQGAAVFTSDVLTIPSRTANGYLWFAVDEDPGYPDSLIVSTNPVTNQLAFYQRQSGALLFGSANYIVGVNPNLLNPARLVGARITLGYSA